MKTVLHEKLLLAAQEIATNHMHPQRLHPNICVLYSPMCVKVDTVVTLLVISNK
jgi:hypothetical protein